MQHRLGDVLRQHADPQHRARAIVLLQLVGSDPVGAMLLVSGVIGIVFAPRTQGRDLAETGAEEVRTGLAEYLQAA
jgi:hypothetical protein